MKAVIILSVLLLGFEIAALAQSQPTFTPAPGSPFAVGNGPYALAVGDFNGDGIKDLAIANSVSGTITVFLGNGSGGFTAAKGGPYAVGPNSIAVGDFNGDGIEDLAATSAVGNVAVLLGDGKGGFTAAAGSPFAAGTNPVRVAVADFNGDGVQDLAVANQGSNNVTVLLGNGLGGFKTAAGSPFAVGMQPFSVAVGDFNRDGIEDLATANTGSGDVTVLLGNGSGGFAPATGSPYISGGEPGGVVVGDFNKDGISDLAVANAGSGSNNVSVLLGNGSGGFTAAPGSPFAAGTSPISVAVGDFNGDGIQDLVTANTGGGNVTLLLGNGSGGFTSATSSPFAVGTEPFFVAVGDFNGDGSPDLATANFGSGTVTVLLNNAHVSAATPVINKGGVVPVYSSATTIQPGEWVSVYGSNLATATMTWNGDFPTSLGGTSVTINGKKAYLWYVSPGQINLQAPDDTTTGSVSVVVTTPSGTAASTVTLGAFGPALSLLDGKHVAGIILRSDGSGAYGGGGYDIVGPTGTSLGYKTVAAKAGDILELYGVGFGPTNPVVLAGQIYSGAAAATNSVQLSINNVTVLPAFAGLTSAGLYQINVVQLPAGLGVGDVPLVASVGGVQTPTGVVISLQ